MTDKPTHEELEIEAAKWRRGEVAVTDQLDRLSKWTSSPTHAAQIDALEWVLAIAESEAE